MVWKILINGFFNRFIPEDSSCLDLGAGYGEFANNVVCGKMFAMDMNPATRNHLKAGITFLEQDCSSYWNLPSNELDVVFTSNFLEHLHDKKCIEQTIEQCYRCLKIGGLMICMGPNVKVLPGAYWDFWDHHVPLTDAAIAECLKIKGFTIESVIPRFLPYTMSMGRVPPRFLIELYLKLPFLWPLFGRQFLVIARKQPKMDK